MAENAILPKVELLKADDVAKLLATTPQKVTAAILNGTFPVGIVAEGGKQERTRTIIIKRRLEKWMNGDDLGSHLKHM